MISYPYHRGQKWSGKCLSVKCNWRPEQRLPSRIRFRLVATFAHFGFCSLMPGFRCPTTLLGSFCKKHLVSFLDLKIIIQNNIIIIEEDWLNEKLRDLCPWFLIRKAIWYVSNCRIFWLFFQRTKLRRPTGQRRLLENK